MNILVIGNGFDLAHGLPTKYTDFLLFCRIIKSLYCVESIDEPVRGLWDELEIEEDRQTNDLKEFFCELYKLRRVERKHYTTIEEKLDGIVTDTCWDEFAMCIGAEWYRNLWILYFLNNGHYAKENWIDFECEISTIIKSLDDAMMFKNEQVQDLDDLAREIDNDFLTRIYIEGALEGESAWGRKGFSTFGKIKESLLEDLNKLIRALEIYLCEYISKIHVEVVAPEIESLAIDHVLSFNYTDTYEKVYGNSRNGSEIEEYDYIHGKAYINNTLDSNNMVLGIDEYLSDERKDSDVKFIEFKKFYQRVYKGSKMGVKSWCGEIKKQAEYENYSRKFLLEKQIEYELINISGPDEYTWTNYEKNARVYDEIYRETHKKHRVYIYGHSLDVTDKDVLRDLILNDNVYTTIFYYSKDGEEKSDLRKKLANLTRLIGEDELIRRTAGDSKTISFVMQENMVKR